MSAASFVAGKSGIVTCDLTMSTALVPKASVKMAFYSSLVT